MVFPVFEMPWLGTRWLIGSVAILHVLINHAAAIGGSLLVVLMERRGHLSGDPRWEALAYRLAFIFFLLTTTVGALSGVGIWFTSMVGAPVAIGSLLRIFFWAWFAEWLVFVLEIGLITAYFLSWHRFKDKTQHLRLGYMYVAASFLTMVIVTGILGAMMTPGRWLASPDLWQGFFGPTYLPQLLLRSGLALGLAGASGMLLARLLVSPDFLPEVERFCARFLLAAVPLAFVGGMAYLAVLPDTLRDQIPTALVTSRLVPYVQASYALNGTLALVVLAVAGLGLRRAKAWPAAIAAVPLLAMVLWLGQFERVREFVRKPYLIPGLLYANGIWRADVPRLNREGVLPQARFATVHRATVTNQREAGREIYKLECATCHTIGGINGLQGRLGELDAVAIGQFLGVQHRIHPFMPPFVGTPAEQAALAAYLASLRHEGGGP